MVVLASAQLDQSRSRSVVGQPLSSKLRVKNPRKLEKGMIGSWFERTALLF